MLSEQVQLPVAHGETWAALYINLAENHSRQKPSHTKSEVSDCCQGDLEASFQQMLQI